MQSIRGIDAIERILIAAGFQVNREPILLGSSFLPVSPDIVASRDNKIYVIEIKSRYPLVEKAFSVNIAQQVKTSGEIISKSSVEKKEVQSILVMVEGEASERLLKFSNDENVKLVRVDNQFLDRAISETDNSKLIQLAKVIIDGGI